MAKRAVADLDGPDLAVEKVPLADIEFDESNPNTMDPMTYETLKADIRDEGFVQPVVLWRRPDGQLRMVDGEHRARVLLELGYRNVPSVVIVAPTEDDARIRLLTLNRLRGQFVPVRLAMLLADLVQRVPEKELRRRLGMDETELRDNLRLANFTDDAAEVLREAITKEAAEAPVTLRFVVNARDAEVVERVVAAVVDGKLDRGKALTRICSDYEKTHKKGS